MKIEKALSKQKRYKKISFIVMMFLFIVLPILAYLANADRAFILIFLLILEALIFIQLISNYNFYYLKFNISNNKCKFKSGAFGNESLVLCDKVAIVHTKKKNENMEIVIVTDVRFKNRKLRPITKAFLRRYPQISHEYLKIKNNNPQKIYYFQIVRFGGVDKYILLDNIYKNCVSSVYTSAAIESIKIARGQNEF